MEEEEEEMIETKREFPIFRDIRRYTCAYCGIVRSKKTLITTHILQSHHQDEIKEEEGDDENGGKKNVCEECGVSFKKPAHLKQHMQSHSLEGIKIRFSNFMKKRILLCDALDPNQRTPKCEILIGLVSGRVTSCEAPSSYQSRDNDTRPFICPIDDCDSSYRRKDHLNRHLLQHEGKLFDCPNENCEKKFSIQGNMTRHVREIHDDVESTNADVDDRKQHACSEPGCGKVFKYVSKLQKHEESHVRLETREAFCAEPGCMKYFSNVKCLKAHLQSCHQHVTCEICGSKHLKKNIKRHLRTHENIASKDKIQCSFDGCSLTFSKSSNLQQHVKAAHFQEKPYVCSISGCGMRFSFKHVRDNHEKSGRHVYTLGDFVEGDDEFRSRPRGGVKRKLPVKIDALMRKRVCPPSECDELHGSDYISWLLSTEDED